MIIKKHGKKNALKHPKNKGCFFYEKGICCDIINRIPLIGVFIVSNGGKRIKVNDGDIKEILQPRVIPQPPSPPPKQPKK